MPDDTLKAEMRPEAPEVLGSVTLVGGHRADLIRETGPDGKEIVFHHRIVTHSYVDRLHADGVLAPGNQRLAADMRDAAERLADDHRASGVTVGTARAVDPERIGGGSSVSDPIRDPEAWDRYTAALDSLTPMDRVVAVRACIEQRFVALAPLRSALMGLARWYRRGGA